MAKNSLIWIVACTVVSCECQAQRTHFGPQTKLVKRLFSEAERFANEATEIEEALEAQDVVNEHLRTVLDNLSTKQDELETKRQAFNTCDEGWDHFDGHCYLVVLEGSGKTWDDASAYCESRNSYLLEITTDAELELAAGFKRYIKRHWYSWIWIGATDRDTEGTFRYQHGRQRVPENFWKEGQPDNYYNNEHCAAVRLFHDDFELVNDRRCYWHADFVCEKQLTPI